MVSSRLIRKLAAVSAALGILFAQFMVAAYACPPATHAAQAQLAEVSEMPCHQQSSRPDGLCEAHCQDQHKNVPAALAPLSADFVPAFVVRLPDPQASAQIAAATSVDEATPHHSPPILLRNACFRI